MVFVNILGGLLLLFLGGESLVRGAVKIAKRFNISKLIIGITIVAYGTSSPELLITLQASLKDMHDIALGNVLGSNIANILLVLGLASVLYPIKVDEELVKFDMTYMLIASFVLFGFVMTGVISRIEALIFLAILGVYTLSTINRHKKNKQDVMRDQVAEIEEHIKVKISNNMSIGLVVGGIIMLTIGGNILVVGASDLARIFGLSEAAIAVTIVAIGGSAPELATSVVAAYRKHSEIAIANVIGSNIFNILGVLGISSLASPIVTRSTLSLFDIWVVLFASLLLYIFVKKKMKLSRLNGITFLFFYFLYVSWQFIN